MPSVLDWTYWHLNQGTTRRVLGGATPVVDWISPGQLPPGAPARQVAMSILRGSTFQPWDGNPLAGWHRVTLGVDARAEAPETVEHAAELGHVVEPPALSFGGDTGLSFGGDFALSFGGQEVLSPEAWCQDVLTKIRDNLLAFNETGVPVTNEGIAVVSIGQSFEISWAGQDDSGRELWHMELPIVYAEVA